MDPMLFLILTVLLGTISWVVIDYKRAIRKEEDLLEQYKQQRRRSKLRTGRKPVR